MELKIMDNIKISVAESGREESGSVIRVDGVIGVFLSPVLRKFVRIRAI